MVNYRIIYNKNDRLFYCQKSYSYYTWFGFGKKSIGYKTLERWCEGSNYPPYSEGRDIDQTYTSLDEAKKSLKDWMIFNREEEITVVYEIQ